MPHPETTKLEDARKKILAAAENLALETEYIPVMQACGRISAEKIISPIDLPQTDNAAVDGFAIYAEAQQNKPDMAMKIVGTARAGHPFIGQVKSGEAIRIYTGAVVPEGPNCILMHEDCVDRGDSVICGKMLARGVNIRPRGENLALREIIVEQGQKITAADMGQLAASGRAQIAVYRQLRVALYSTGDEVVEAGQRLAAGQIYDSNRPILAGLLHHEGAALIDGGIIPDTEEGLLSAYEDGLAQADIIISSGGASDGVEDHTQKVVTAMGAKCLFWRLAMKPGRPMAVAQRHGKMIFCLPGNPVAAFVCFKLLVAPAIDKLSGRTPQERLAVRLAAGFAHKKRSGRAEYLRAVIHTDKEGGQHIFLHGRKGAGVISSLTGADGLVEIPFDCEEIHPGDMLNFLPFQELAL